MITGQICIAQLFTAIQADVAVTLKQRGVGKRRNLGVSRHNPSVTRDDAVYFLRAYLTTVLRSPAADGDQWLADSPNHKLSGIQTNSILPCNPFNGLAGDIQAKNSGYTFEIGQSREHDGYLR